MPARAEVSRTTAIANAVVTGVGAAGLLVGVGYALYGRIPSLAGHLTWSALAVLPVYAVAVWLVRRRPDHPQARRLLLVAAASALGIAVESAVRVAYPPVGAAPGWLWAANLGHQLTMVVASAAAGVLIGTYPDGLAENRAQRRVVRTIWTLLLIPFLLLVSHPTLLISPYLLDARDGPTVMNPFALPWLEPLGQLLELLLLASAPALLGVALLLVRFVRAGGAQRRRMRVLLNVMAGAAVAVLAWVAMSVLGVPADSPWLAAVETVFLLAAFALPVAIVVGVLRHRLFDIDVVARRSVVYGVLTVGIAALYAVLAAAPGLALGSQVPVQLAVILTVLAAVAFSPLRRRLEALADRWVFGERVSRYQLVTSFGAALERTVDLHGLLPGLAATVGRGLRAPWVRVRLRGEEPGSWLAAPEGLDGVPSGPSALTQELRHAGEVVGVIECGARDGGYDESDRELLATLARQAATAIANVRLGASLRDRVEELARSRARIVAAQDTERRRIERDIHDGVQQEVVAMIAKLRLARNRHERGESPADLLAELQRDAGELLADLRELAHGIHPPVLSDGGLVAAVEARAGRLPLDVRVRADGALRERALAADVEAAAYFVVSESLANVMKHAHAERVLVDLAAADSRLSVTVRDDGTWAGSGNGDGQGLTNLRDRVEALGGHFRVDAGNGAGTRVTAELPMDVRHA